jgi:NRAMP (natural resistance-associated macrophage protein)-like metal ion transporter
MLKIPLFKRITKYIGPGVITGVADDDPSGIVTYAQTGAVFGLTQLWLTVLSLPFMIAIQEMCGRIGIVTGKGLAGVIKMHYPKYVLYGAVVILAFANIINIGADLGAMASAAELVLPVPFGILVAVLTIVTVLVEITVPYRTYVKFLKYLALTVLAYIFAAFAVEQDWYAIIMSVLIPQVEWNQSLLLNITAVLGTTISPYLFFWQASEEVEEEIINGNMRAMGKGVPKITYRNIQEMRKDTILGMFLSNLVAFFIIITASGTLGLQGITELTSAAQVAESLRPFAGDGAFLLFTLGILGTGLLAVPVLAGSAAYALSEAFGWKAGLGRTFHEAPAFYLVIIVATLVGVLINFLPINPITMLYYSAALNGVLAPPLMIIILLISNNKKILGERVNGKLSNIFGWIITVIMSLLSVIFFMGLF